MGYLPPAELPDAEYPFFLNTGRQMYHWHTGTMTRRSTALDARESGPIVELHPAFLTLREKGRRRAVTLDFRTAWETAHKILARETLAEKKSKRRTHAKT